jgi:hypothetical protein
VNSRTQSDIDIGTAVRRPRAGRRSAGSIARSAAALAVAALLTAAAGASAAVHLTTGATYTGKSSACQQATIPGTTCVFAFRASARGFALRFVGETVVSSWACPHGGGEALLGGKVNGNDPIPLLRVRSNGDLYGSAGSGPSEVAVSGYIAEAGTKAVVRFHLVHQHCVSPRVTVIEGLVVHGGR